LNKKKGTYLLKTGPILLLILAYQLLLFSMIAVQANANVMQPPGIRMIDLFTQKEPYSGRGLNNASDAFSPRLESKVVLYALVTYNEEPLEGWQVGFQVDSPKPLPGFPLVNSSFTNASGIASISFRLQQVGYSEESFFGKWVAVANVEIAGAIVSDTLTFKVGYIVEIVSVATIDENLNPKSRFPGATCVGTKLHIRNIAMLPRTATIVVTAYDRLRNAFDSIILDNFTVEPGENYIFTHCFLNVSEQAEIGNAVINASAYTAFPIMGGVPYCPEVSAGFVIISRDVAVVEVTTSAVDVVAGEVVNVTVTVKNKGGDTETFSVNAYYGDFLIDTFSVESLAPDQNRTLTFFWNTTYVPAGSYTISAVAEALRGETERGDNAKIDGAVLVRVPRIFLFPRELSIVALVVAVALALFAMIILLTRRRSNPYSVTLNVDILSS